MAENGYWQRFVHSRVSRRRALATGGTLIGGAVTLSLVGCGGDDDDAAPSTGGAATGSPSTGGTGSTGTSSLVYQPADSTSQAKPGGTLLDFLTGDAEHFDPGSSDRANVINPTSVYVYPRLVSFVLAKFPEIADGSVEGEVAEGYEVSPDRLTITFKIRQGMAWDQRAPTNGRAIDADDVIASWERYSVEHPTAASLVYSEESKSAPIESLEASDSRTLVMKLREPDHTVLPALADFVTFYVLPQEAANGGFDPQREIRGHGPWILEEYEPSVGFTFVRNPDYFLKDRPFIERMERPIVPEYAQRQAQFRAGNIYTSVYSPADVLVGMKDVKEALALQADAHERNGLEMVFGMENNSPFRDVRVRQAFSMAIDRDSYGEVVENVSAYADAGLDVDMVNNAIIWAGWDHVRLDPNDTAAFGENHVYVKYNPEESAKLRDAAGFKDGLNVTFSNVVGYSGAEFERSAELLVALLNQEGMGLQHHPITYQEFSDSWSRAYGFSAYEKSGEGYEGVLHRTGRGWSSLGLQLFDLYHKSGRHPIWDPVAQTPHAGDPELNPILESYRQSFDREEQIGLMHDFIRNFAGKMHTVIKPTTSKTFELYWPVIGNLGVFNTMPAGSEGAERRRNWWLDSTKAPLA
jgi:peptide/nickel transport system substrate-binding protein